MHDADCYYDVSNIEIFAKERLITDGKRMVRSELSNNKIPSSFVRTAVNQKVNYAFGKPFVYYVENYNLTKRELSEDDKANIYLREWNKHITPQYRRDLQRFAFGAVNYGIGWAHLWADNKGKLHKKTIDSKLVYPIWEDAAHTELTDLLYLYVRNEFVDGAEKAVEYIKHFNDDLESTFRCDGDTLVHLGSLVNIWGKIPFVWLQGSYDEKPLLYTAKQQIDSYDTLNSVTCDSLMDDISPILHIDGYEPDLAEMTKWRSNIANMRLLLTSLGAKAEYLHVRPDVTANINMLESLKRQILQSTQTVDTRDIPIESNPSGIVMKCLYQDTDTFINSLETSFESSMERECYFMNKALSIRGVGEFDDYCLSIKLVRDMMINESQLIQDIAMLGEYISQETRDNYNPAVDSHEEEVARREADLQRQRELMSKYSDILSQPVTDKKPAPESIAK